MKWTAEGKKIGDKIAIHKDRWSRVIVLVEITGETKTQWIIPNHRVRKSDGLLLGSYHRGSVRRAYDADDETVRITEQQEKDALMNDRREAIARWVRGVSASSAVELLWPVVGKLIEGEQA